MNAVWSWDNSFHALCVAKAYPEMAFYNMLLPFYFMSESGALPDTVTPKSVTFGFTKPPVHAFIYDIMEQMNPYFQRREVVREFYPYLCRNLAWWCEARGEIPCYWHGNDSGADNSTCFDRHPVVASPDLYACIAFTAKKLAQFAKLLELPEDQQKYSSLADRYGRQIEPMFFDSERFFVLPQDGKGAYHSEGLLPLRALMASEYLSPRCVEKCVDRLGRDFLGNWGLTSESHRSEKRVEGAYGSYWRGSMWGPEQLLLARALDSAGYPELAEEITERYCRALESFGCGENHNSLTGEANCAKCYVWSAAVGIYRAHQIARKSGK